MKARYERPLQDEYAPYYERYVSLVGRGDIAIILRDQLEDTRELLRRVPAGRADFAYAPGKWSITQVVGHVADVERVFAFRALWIARGDLTPLPGFDENEWQPLSGYDTRPLGQVVEELSAVRTATIALLHGLPEEAWSRRGVASNVGVSVRGIVAIIAGHELHHQRILEERYLSALQQPSR